jgi:hypothetical protein
VTYEPHEPHDLQDARTEHYKAQGKVRELEDALGIARAELDIKRIKLDQLKRKYTGGDWCES